MRRSRVEVHVSPADRSRRYTSREARQRSIRRSCVRTLTSYAEYVPVIHSNSSYSCGPFWDQVHHYLNFLSLLRRSFSVITISSLRLGQVFSVSFPLDIMDWFGTLMTSHLFQTSQLFSSLSNYCSPYVSFPINLCSPRALCIFISNWAPRFWLVQSWQP